MIDVVVACNEWTSRGTCRKYVLLLHGICSPTSLACQVGIFGGSLGNGHVRMYTYICGSEF